LSTWIEERNEALCPGIDGRQIWPFVSVAARTRERKILQRIRATMLSGPHVLDLKTGDRCCALRQSAVLTAIRRSPLNSPSSRCVHQRLTSFFRTDRAFAWSTVMKSMADRYVSYSPRSLS